MQSSADGSEAFVTFGRGLLKVFNAAKNFGFVSPVFKGKGTEGPSLPASCEEGLWFFGNHALPSRAAPGLELTFEIWESAQGKAQARSVAVASEPTANVSHALGLHHGEGSNTREMERRLAPPRLHPNEPRVIYPSVYVSDVPVEWNEAGIRALHTKLGLNPDAIIGVKFLPFTEVSLGDGNKGERQSTPVTGAVILRYLNEEAANAGVERLKGHPIQTSNGVSKHLGAKHATPPRWVMQRRQQEDEDKKSRVSAGESISQKVRGIVVRVSMSGYGVIKSAEWGEVMWRQYELPTNLRTLQFADKAKFQKEAEGREDFRRLKEMEGKQVEAELYKLPDGQLRASHVRALHPGMMEDSSRPAMLEDRRGMELPPGFFLASEPVEEESGPSHGFTEQQQQQQQQAFRQGPPQGGMPSIPGFGGPPGFNGPPPGMGQPPGAPGMPGPPPGMGPPGMMLGVPPGMDPYQAQMMMMHAQMMQQSGVKDKKKDKKDKKDKRRKEEKRDRRRRGRSSSSSSNGRSPKRQKKIDDDDF